MVHTVDGGGAVRRNIHPADLNKDGKISRQEAQQHLEKKVSTPAPKPAVDVNEAKYPTVGEAVENALTDAKNEFFESAKIAGVMAIPGVNVAAGIVYARHMNEARKEIAQLPMDPQGKWKAEANQIISRHHEAAEDEIIALPGKVAKGAVNAVEGAVDAVGDAVEGAVEAVETAVDSAVDAAEAVWGGVTDAAETAWEFAKTEVPRAAKELGQDAAVLAIMANPLGAAPSAIIIGNHVAQANQRIMALPMDPEGKWKTQAREIVREEMAEAKQEILGLPGRAWEGVKDVSATIYTGARNAVIATGEAIVDVGEAVVDGATAAAVAVGRAVDQTVQEITESFDNARKGLGDAFQRFGRWIAGGN